MENHAFFFLNLFEERFDNFKFSYAFFTFDINVFFNSSKAIVPCL